MEDTAEETFTTPKKQLRAVATIELYIYGETDAELIDNAKAVCKKLNLENDCGATLQELVEQPFGTFGNRPINL